MSTAIATVPGDDLATMNIDMDAVYRALNLNPRDPKSQALFLTCRRYDLDPVLKHAVLISGTLYITRDGLLHVAHATGKLDGLQVDYTGLDETKTHYVAVATVHRKDMSRPFVMRGRYPVASRMAKDYGPEMAEKVALCRALRMAFDVSLCSREELWDQPESEHAAAPNYSRQPQPKAIEAEIIPDEVPVPKTYPGRDLFVETAGAWGITFDDPKERGLKAIELLGADYDETKGISNENWILAGHRLDLSMQVAETESDSDIAGFDDPLEGQMPEGAATDGR